MFLVQAETGFDQAGSSTVQERESLHMEVNYVFFMAMHQERLTRTSVTHIVHGKFLGAI